MKRSHAPIFWSLFGAGGVLSALFGPVLVFITGFAGLPGFGLPPEALAYSRALGFTQTLGGKAFLFAVIAMFLWHAAHRLYHCLHDFGLHPGIATKIFLYGSALTGSLGAAALLLTIGR